MTELTDQIEQAATNMAQEKADKIAERRQPNMSVAEKLEVLHAELAEWGDTLSEMRRRLADPNEVKDSQVAFHQEVLIKMQHSAWDVEREIISLTPKEA